MPDETNVTKQTNETGLEIAVIGMAGRFPGARDIHEFWDNLKNGAESIAFFSDQELEESGVEPELIDDPAYVKAKGVVDDVEYFDAAFFGYSPTEARLIDPQVRVFHECAWEALENAGYDPERFEGKIGLYAGASSDFFWQILTRFSGAGDMLDSFSLIHLINRDFLTTRISYKLNLRGPSFFIQTACSTSLVAIHLACQGLLSGECAMALAGGVTISLPLKSGHLYRGGMVLSPDGSCRAFDAAAEGFAGGDGAGAVALKLLEDAAADGDFIHAVIKGSAINNDGCQKAAFSAPSFKAQTGVVKAALSMAEVHPETIGYVETHGTGTQLGDPIEIEALKRAFNTDKKAYCKIGSVKTNIGHLDSAAGVASFIKTVLALEHRQIPPSLHFNTPNPNIDFKNSPFIVNTQLSPWPNPKYPLRAGVTSLGIGGTNVHAVLEEAPRPQPYPDGRPWKIIPLSARTQPALDRVTENLLRHLEAHPGVNENVNLADAAFTLQVGRKAMKRRRMLVCADIDEAKAALSEPTNIPTHRILEDKNPAVFMFAGLGAQYENLALDLYREEPLFREHMDRCFDILKPLMDYDIKQILYPSPGASGEDSPSSAIHRIENSQLVVFIIEYALAQLLITWGVKPQVMIGYSFGEYTAACISGVFSLEDALKIILCRGRLLARAAPGAMLSVPLSRDRLTPSLPEEISLAIDNGSSCIVAGTQAAVASFEKTMKAKKLMCMPVPHTVAMHSHMMDPILAPFEQELASVQFDKPQIPFISNLTGKPVNAEEVVKPTYWRQHLRETVCFSGGISHLAQKPAGIFIEIGPGRDLSTMVKRYFKDNTRQKALNLIRPPQKNDADVYYLLKKLGYLWLYGVNIDWAAFYSGEKRRRVPLPAYPFQRQRLWIDTTLYQLSKELLPANPVSAGQPVIDDAAAPITAEPDPPSSPRSELNTPYVAPANALERVMAQVWEQFFGITPIGTRDDFFELGGDSLKAMNISTMIQRELSVEIPVAEFFRKQTIEGLAQYVKEKPRGEIGSTIGPAEDKQYYPLSSAQARLFVMHQIDPHGIGYNFSIPLAAEGDLDPLKLEQAVRAILEKHETLRTSIQVIRNIPFQKIHPPHAVQFAVEYSEASEEDAKEIFNRFVRPFDLAKPPFLRVGLVKTGQEKYILMVDLHHILTDAVSLDIFIKELTASYSGQPLTPLEIQYKDFSEWQYKEKQNKSIKQREDFWLRQFEGEIPVLDLPADYIRSPIQNFEGKRVSFQLGKERTAALRKLAADEGATLFILLLALYNVFLARICGQEDIITGTTIAGRAFAGLEKIIGMFVNTLAIRNYPGADMTFRQFLAEVKKRTFDVFDNQDYQFEDLVEKLAVKRVPGRNPLFDVMFQLNNVELGALELPGLTLTPFPNDKIDSKFDMTLFAEESGEDVLCSLHYNPALFMAETIRSFVNYFNDIAGYAAENPGMKISQMGSISEEEKIRQISQLTDDLEYDLN
jgi:acyl transferase domain-containing protein